MSCVSKNWTAITFIRIMMANIQTFSRIICKTFASVRPYNASPIKNCDDMSCTKVTFTEKQPEFQTGQNAKLQPYVQSDVQMFYTV